MAKDILGLMNGIRRVAVAFSNEIGSELQALAQSSVGPLTHEQHNEHGPHSLQLPSLPDPETSEGVFGVGDSQLAREFEELKRSQASQPNSLTQPQPTPSHAHQYHSPSTPSHSLPTTPTRKYHSLAVSSHYCHMTSMCSTRRLHTSTLQFSETMAGSRSNSRQGKRKATQKVGNQTLASDRSAVIIYIFFLSDPSQSTREGSACLTSESDGQLWGPGCRTRVWYSC